MAQLIDKDAVVAEIEKRIKEREEEEKRNEHTDYITEESN